MNGITVTIPAGGAESDNLANRLRKDATSDEERCLIRKEIDQ